MLVYVLAIGAAILFGIGSVVQQRAASQAPPGKSLKLSLLLYLARQPLWLAGVATAILGNLLSGAALGRGSVALVQPLLVTRLLFAIPLSAAWARRSLHLRDWLGLIATAAGLGAFIAFGQPQQAEGAAPPLWRWGITVAAIGVVTFVLVLLARRLAPHREAQMLGAGAGMLFGLQAGLTHTAVGHFFDGGIAALLTTWSPYAVAAVAILGTLLLQSAYEMAPLPASYPTLAAVEPLAGIGIGIGVVGGSLNLGLVALLGQIVSLAVMTTGIYLLASSPLVVAHQEIDQWRREEGLAYQIEDELEDDLKALTADLEAATGNMPGAHRMGGKRRDLGRDIERVNDALGRLHELRSGIERHRAAAVHDLANDPAASDRAEREQQVARDEHLLDTRLAEIDQRAHHLEQRAAELVERARNRVGRESDPGDQRT